MGKKKGKQNDKSKKKTDEKNKSNNDAPDDAVPSSSIEGILPTIDIAMPGGSSEENMQQLDLVMEKLVEHVQRCELTIKSALQPIPSPSKSNERYTPDTQRIDVEAMVENLTRSRVFLQPETKADIVFRDQCDVVLQSKWPRFKKKVPAIFIHEPFKLADCCREILSRGIKFYKPYLRENYIKVLCPTIEDHIALTKYFNREDVPYHTFGDPNEKFLKLIIRGLPDDVDMDKLKLALRASGIPLTRMHKMFLRKTQKPNKSFILVVVPLRSESKKILRIYKIFDHDVTIETPQWKSKQCHRCLRWGHTQRYCRGDVKCVKCAGPHLSEDCRTGRLNRLDLVCANCFGRHAASYRWCSYCPDSEVYQMNQRVKEELQALETNAKAPLEIVTIENCHRLYANLDYSLLD